MAQSEIEEIREGKMVVVVDDEDRENEGDLVMAAQFVTPDAIKNVRLACRRTFSRLLDVKKTSLSIARAAEVAGDRVD